MRGRSRDSLIQRDERERGIVGRRRGGKGRRGDRFYKGQNPRLGRMFTCYLHSLDLSQPQLYFSGPNEDCYITRICPNLGFRL